MEDPKKIRKKGFVRERDRGSVTGKVKEIWTTNMQSDQLTMKCYKAPK